MWLILAILGPIMGGFTAILWKGSSEIISPTRMPLSKHQKEALSEPSLHIQNAIALDGKVPYLIISPVQNAEPSERGRKIRNDLTHEGLQLRPYGETQGLLVLLHGRRGRKEGMIRVAERFAAAGFRCLVPDLPAHGESPLQTVAYGSSPFEKSLPLSLVKEAQQTFDWPLDEPLGLWGMSMGGAFATAALANATDWNAAIIVSSFDNLDGVISHKLRRLAGPMTKTMNGVVKAIVLRRSGLVIDQVDSTLFANQSTTPVFCLHGDRDPFIESSRGKNLFNHFSIDDKQWLDVKDGDHNNVLITAQPVYAPMCSWFLPWLQSDTRKTKHRLPKTTN
ncbi:MAG: dienelactone hydrolase [Verrucomicrobiales bacterium]|jgi:dienelactone hydrolase